jgi:hypothetical protein
MASEKLQIGDRIASLPTRRQGVLDVPRHGYLGFKLAPSGQTIFYLTGGHISDADTALEIENLHLVTLDIQAEGGLEYRDHGSIGLDTDGIPSNVNSVAVSADGTVYAIAGISKPDGSKRYDLIAFQHVDIRSKRFVPGSSAAAAPLPD